MFVHFGTKKFSFDINRGLAPLVLTQDAIIIDSSNLDVDQVINQICEFLN